MIRNIIITESQLNRLYECLNEEIHPLDGSDSTEPCGGDNNAVGTSVPIIDPNGVLDQERGLDVMGSDEIARTEAGADYEGLGKGCFC